LEYFVNAKFAHEPPEIYGSYFTLDPVVKAFKDQILIGAISKEFKLCPIY